MGKDRKALLDEFERKLKRSKVRYMRIAPTAQHQGGFAFMGRQIVFDKNDKPVITKSPAPVVAAIKKAEKTEKVRKEKKPWRKTR